MTAAEVLTQLIAADPRRDYHLREFTSSIMDGDTRAESFAEFHIMIVPGFSGRRRYTLDGDTWAEVVAEAVKMLAAQREIPLP